MVINIDHDVDFGLNCGLNLKTYTMILRIIYLYDPLTAAQNY